MLSLSQQDFNVASMFLRCGCWLLLDVVVEAEYYAGRHDYCTNSSLPKFLAREFGPAHVCNQENLLNEF